jgi:hypothetical protein
VLKGDSSAIVEDRVDPRSLAQYLVGPSPAGDFAAFTPRESPGPGALRCVVTVAVESVGALELGGCIKPGGTSMLEDGGGEYVGRLTSSSFECCL